MSKKKVLLQIDTDKHASVFDSVVAFDCEIDQLLTQADVDDDDIEGLIHGTMFTRGPQDLHNTAVFFGGSNVQKTEQLVAKAKSTFFGPMRVSIMSDPNGSNTTAASAVLCALQHSNSFTKVTVLAGTGPVGQRIARLIAPYSDEVLVCSRKLDRAESVCKDILANVERDNLTPCKTSDNAEIQIALHNSDLVFAAGAAGIELAGEGWMETHDRIKIAVDINAVSPTGLHGIEVMDNGTERAGKICYGAIGVGGLKMKIHKQCIRSLFESNDKVLETDEIFQIGQSLLQN